MDFTLIRGDTYNLTFSLSLANGNAYILSENDKCYFTVKKDLIQEDYVFQKRNGAGIEYNEEQGLYRIKIEQEDTCDLNFGTYQFDIKVKIGDEIVKTLLKGTFVLTNNATHRCNE
jgi:hypothetical protein